MTARSVFLAVAVAAAAVLHPVSASAQPIQHPDFFWMPPTVPSAPTTTGPFDAEALEDLAVEVCELNGAGFCVAGPPIERMTAFTSPTPMRITLDAANEFYTVDWLTGPSQVNRDLFYRVRVLKGDVEAGAIDVDFVQNKPELATVDATRYIGVIRGQQVTLRFRIQQPTPRTRVKVNETESNQGVPGDWIELYNTAPVPLDLSGHIVKDNDDTHVYTFPDGTTIPANGFYVVEEAALDFGLGANEMARLFTPDGILIDAAAWTAHSPTTHGRCPDGTGAFQVMTTVTKGAANDCRILLVINEIESDGGTPDDWVELFNPGPGPANLTGFVLRDSSDLVSYPLPSVVVPANSYVVLEALGFTLDGADAVRLFRPDGTIADQYQWTVHAPTTYGRCPNGSGAFTQTRGSTKGAPNNCFVPVTTVHINEVESNGGTPGDWFELINIGATSVDLTGWSMLDNDDSHTAYVFPAGSTIGPGGYLVIEESGFGFGLGQNESVRIFDPTGVLYEEFTWGPHALTTYGRCPNGTGAFQVMTTVTKGAANDCSVAIRVNEVESNGGSPGDWIELINVGPAAANIGGFVVKDNDDTHVHTIPAGTTIAAGGYYIVEEAALGFGLGAADSARLFDTSGAVVDSYSWAAHAPLTYGRCPNGSGAFAPTFASTKAAANICTAPITTVHINEVESNGGTPGDWFELINTGAAEVDLSSFRMVDNDASHAQYVFPAGTVIGAGGYLVIEEANFGFGLGAADSVRIFDAGGTLYEEFSWTAHAATTYGRCPNGTGGFVTSNTSTKGAANDCANPIKINEVESSGGTPGDWIELINPTSSPVDISGLIVRDSVDGPGYAIPAGTTVPANGYFVVEEAVMGFGLGGGDSARVFDPGGALLDSFTWTVHAATTYGRCPNGTGAFAETTSSTKGAVNACPGDPLPWPGDPAVQAVDAAGAFPSNLSGLAYEGPGVLWAARNGPGSLYRLVFNGSIWTPDTTNNWSAGKLVRYPDGTGEPDAEGVAFADAGSNGGLYVATERNNQANSISRLSILRFDVGMAGPELIATHEWNLTADLPAVGANLGLEGITFIPDAFLVANNFLDERTNNSYNPATYPNHGAGLFFVGVEGTGSIYAYALIDDGTFFRIATISSGFLGVMDLTFDADTGNLWAVCDDTCNGQTAVLRIGATQRFAVVGKFDRPAAMPNINNEGFTMAPLSECSGGQRAVFWSDDSGTGGHAIRRGSMSCSFVP